MKTAIKAGTFYFVLIFAAAFVLGSIRIRLIVPYGGTWAGLAFELPAILTLAWLACRWLVRGFRVPATVPARLAMGGWALALLLAVQTSVAAIGLGQSPGELLAGYQEPNMMIGLAVQLLFAAMPCLRMQIMLAQRAG
jgi:hypothetical protein